MDTMTAEERELLDDEETEMALAQYRARRQQRQQEARETRLAFEASRLIPFHRRKEHPGVEKIIELQRHGYSVTQITGILGVSRSTIYKRLAGRIAKEVPPPQEAVDPLKEDERRFDELTRKLNAPPEPPQRRLIGYPKRPTEAELRQAWMTELAAIAKRRGWRG